MKALIVYSSMHHGNTDKIANAIAEPLEADILQINEAGRNIKTDKYDLIGFGSGIYNGKHDEKLFDLIKNLNIKDKNVFVFSTSGTGNKKYNKQLIKLLNKMGANVKDSFSCRGFDTYSFFMWIGGISKGHPSNIDLMNSQVFARRLIIE